jgi:HAD superfamily hydrolase (TIGR01549 family)
MIKVVFFDIDDTLYDHSYHVASAITVIQKEYLILQSYPTDYLIELSHTLLEEVHLQLLDGKISLEESRKIRWQRFLQKCGDPESELHAMEVANAYSRAYYQAERVTPGTIELLEALRKHFTLGMISNNLFDEQLKKVHRLGIAKYFDFFAISEEVGYAKPHPKIFKIALERAGVESHEAILIGDSWENDIVGARNAGIFPIWLNRKGISSPDPQISEITSFEPVQEVLDYILKEIPMPQITNPDPAKL